MALSADTISVSFGGVRALKNVSVTVEPGSIVGLVGPNGAGKTTLFNCLSGVVKPDAGSVGLDGDDITHVKFDQRIRLGLSRTFQTPRIDLESSVRDGVLLGFYPKLKQGLLGAFFSPPDLQRQEAEMLREADRMIEAFGLTADPNMRAGDLSLGRLRMLEVARALAAQPRYLLLDEPAAGIDGHELSILAGAIRKAAGQGVGVLLVEHNVGFVANLCERMVALVQGEVVIEGAPSVVVNDERILKAYLGAMRVAA
jgi:ABC-type branched-subunit amino acid transport system ATPase component